MTAPVVIDRDTFNAVRYMSISGSTEIRCATHVTGSPVAGSEIRRAALVAAPLTPEGQQARALVGTALY